MKNSNGKLTAFLFASIKKEEKKFVQTYFSLPCLQAVGFVLFAILGMQLDISIPWLVHTVTKSKNKIIKNNK